MLSKPSSKKQLLQHNLSFEAIGTKWTLSTDKPVAEETLKLVLSCISLFDQKWSRFRSDSLVTKRSRTAGKLPLDKDEFYMFKLYHDIYKLTHGAVTPLIGQALAHAGYDAKYSFEHQTKQLTTPRWEDTLKLTPSSIHVLTPALLDIGAAGKGLLVDKISTILKQSFSSYTIDAGGDIYVYGHTERIALEDPTDTSRAIGVATLQDQAICGSAINRRAWSGLHHIFNPLTGKPASTVVASWAIAPSTMQADLISTALFFVESDQLINFQDIPYIIVCTNGTVRYAKDERLELYV